MENDLVDERELAAPPDVVFEAWTHAEHLARWFGPDTAETTRCELDARPGGVFRLEHRFPSGEGATIKGVVTALVAPSTFQFQFTFVDDADRPIAPTVFPQWPVGTHIVMTVELHATPRGTRMLVRQRVAETELSSHPAVRRHRELAALGWVQTIARLETFLAERSH